MDKRIVEIEQVILMIETFVDFSHIQDLFLERSVIHLDGINKQASKLNRYNLKNSQMVKEEDAISNLFGKTCRE